VANVYSTRFIQHRGLTNSAPADYVVPAGFRAVVKSIVVYNNDVFQSNLFLEGAVGQAVAYFERSLGDRSIDQQTPDAVYEADELIRVRVVAGTWDVTVCGFLLTLP